MYPLGSTGQVGYHGMAAGGMKNLCLNMARLSEFRSLDTYTQRFYIN